MLELRNCGKFYESAGERAWVFRHVDLKVVKGTLTCLMGASGSGKTTLLNLLGGLGRASEGQVLYKGADLGELADDDRADYRLRHAGTVFQETNLVDLFTAEENVAIPLRAQGVERSAAIAQAVDALESVGIAHLNGRFPHEMSGGQRQRVGVARAVVGDRDILLADEPTGALDRTTSIALFALLKRLSEQGMTVVVATHDHEALAYADTVIEVEQLTGAATVEPAHV